LFLVNVFTITYFVTHPRAFMDLKTVATAASSQY
jgi:hypothetical protein